MPKASSRHSDPHRALYARFSSPVILGAVTALMSACAGDVVNVGENTVPVSDGCALSPIVQGSVTVENQAQLDELAGCTEIEGDLNIVPFRSADLRPLAALRRVGGRLDIGHDVPLEGEPFTLEWEVNQRQRSRLTRWRPSLDGLERLEAVGELLIHAPITDLRPLAALRTITSGVLHLYVEATSLSGLENLRDITTLTLEGGVEDVSALSLPAEMESIMLGAFADGLNASQVESISGALILSDVAMSNLDTFANLKRAGTISIAYSYLLEQIDGLNGVETLGGFSLGETSLKRLPDFTSLREFSGGLRIEDNDVLENFPTFPAMNADTVAGSAPMALEWVRIRNNLALSSILIPPVCRSAERLTIVRNEALREFSFGGLESAEVIEVLDNPSLTNVSGDTLHTVNWLHVEGNGALSPTYFDKLTAIEGSTIRDNAPTS